jgi:hypothetical protein
MYYYVFVSICKDLTVTEFTVCLLLDITNSYNTFTVLFTLKITASHSKSSHCAKISCSGCFVAASSSDYLFWWLCILRLQF